MIIGLLSFIDFIDDDHGMPSTIRIQNTYDHRLRELVQSTGDIDFATRIGIPRSTARGWLKTASKDVFSIDIVEKDVSVLQEEIIHLRKRVNRLTSILRLLIVLMKISGFSLSKVRLPDGKLKCSLLNAINRSITDLPLKHILRILKISPSRYYSWKRSSNCELTDFPSCPKSTPQQLTLEEAKVIKEMATSKKYKHVPTRTLAILAQRLGQVFASSTTWYKIIHKYKLRRPRQRIHPTKTKIGIRAQKPNEIWHVDSSLIRLLDGSRVYLHAVIDNFSRRILAWKVTSTFNPSVTAELLIVASNELENEIPTLFVDGGIENYNSPINELIDSGRLRRILAQTEISYSNSLIESWWKALKHQWLYLNSLDTVNKVKKLVSFYVSEHNSRIPHSAFKGQTPDEMYFGTDKDIPSILENLRALARQKRLETNRATSCQICE